MRHIMWWEHTPETREDKIKRLSTSICNKLNILFEVDDFEFKYDHLGRYAFCSTKVMYASRSIFFARSVYRGFVVNGTQDDTRYFVNTNYEKFKGCKMEYMIKNM